MTGALTLPAGTSLRSSTSHLLSPSVSPRSGRRQMSFPGRIQCRSAVHEFTEAAPAMGTARSGSSLYDVLRVKRNASPAEIKSAYRRMAKLYHPDASSDGSSDGGDFVAIQSAYATLSDPTARAIYDMSMGVSGGLVNRFRGSSCGYYQTRRWETDQCW